MKLPPFELRPVHSEAEALAALAALGSDARVLAGGQSLLPLLRYRMARPHALVDINPVESLRALTLGENAIRIGALVRHSELERMDGDMAGSGALLRAHAREIGFWPVRTRGTAVGSLVHADPKGDWPLAFFALDARVELASERGRRSVPVREFITGALDTMRAVDELVTAVTLDARPALRWGRAKLVHRAGEYAVCNAIVLEDEGRWECWMGAAGDRPFALPALAGALRPGSAARAELVGTAFAELEPLLPYASHVERRRHAVNVVDAAEAAMNRTRPS